MTRMDAKNEITTMLRTMELSDSCKTALCMGVIAMDLLMQISIEIDNATDLIRELEGKRGKEEQA